MSPERLRILDRLIVRLETAPKGDKGRLVAEAAGALGVSPQTVQRWLKDTYGRRRKRRRDAGDVGLTRAEAEKIANYLLAGFRRNDKQGRTLQTAVAVLRANGVIRAERIDERTGEIVPLSVSAIARALRHYRLHPDQLRQPTPHQPLASKHPNHVWELDGSVCVLYYLPGGGAVIEETDPAVHYKNKPHELRRIERQRVIRYALTDHCSGVIRWRYYPVAETGEHTVHFLAWCMAPKGRADDPFEGRPKILMVDPGATSGGLVKRFCRRLGIELIVNQRQNPRAKGSVECAQNIVEMRFEHGLRDIPQEIRSFDDLNRLAELYQRHFNATAIHSRHKMTRFDAWLHIKPEELVRTQPLERLLGLATGTPRKAKVYGDLTVRFAGRVWSVKAVPGITIGEKLPVHWHPFADCAMAIVEDVEGRELHIELEEVTGRVDPAAGHWGFRRDAAVIGQDYKSRPDTEVDANRKQVAQTEPAAIDPYKEAREAPERHYLKRRGQVLEAGGEVARLPVPVAAAARKLRQKLGAAWSPAHYQWLAQRFPGGVPAETLERWLEDDDTLMKEVNAR